MPSEGPGDLTGIRGQGSGVKKSKPAMEKRRRARINASLAELRSLIPESVKRGNRRYSKMEKADILEMAVQYLRLLQGNNKEKNQVSTVSYSLGFNECTQEVNEFFRSSSPDTSRFKGSLLEHLNGCAPTNAPDSPSSSPTQTAKRSASSAFTPSSIIARCLLSSTTIITPEKMSAHARNVSPPAAVSSTSDDSSNEGRLSLADEASETNLDNNTDTSCGDLNVMEQVHRAEVFKVKKDLTNSFNNEACISQINCCKPGTINDNSSIIVDSKHAIPDIRNSSDTFIQLNVCANHETDTPLTTIINSEDAIAAGNLSTTTPVGEKAVPEVQCLNNKDEATASSQIDMAEISCQCDKTMTLINDNPLSETSCLISSQFSDRNNNSKIGTNEKKLNLQQITYSVAVKNTLPGLVVPQSGPNNISDNNIQSPISNSCVAAGSDNNMHIKLGTESSPAPIDLTQASVLSEKVHLSQTRPAQLLEIQPLSKELPEDVTEGPAYSFEIENKKRMTSITASAEVHSRPSVLAQTTFLGDIPPSQQAIIIDSPTKTNNVNLLTICKTLQIIAPTVLHALQQESHFSTTKIQGDLPCSDSFTNISMLSEIRNRFESGLPKAGIVSPKPLCLPLVHQTGFPIEVQNEDNSNDRTMSTLMEVHEDVTVPKAKQFCQTQSTQEIDENCNESCSDAKILSSNFQPTNLPTSPFPVIQVHSSCLTSLQRKRSMDDIDNVPDGKSEQATKAQFENFTDSIKRLKLTHSGLHRPTSLQDAGLCNSALNQYISTKFRPIAPKKEDVHLISSPGFRHEGKSNPRSSVQHVPVEKNNLIIKSVFSNTQCINGQMKMKQGCFANYRSFAGPETVVGQSTPLHPTDGKILTKEVSTNETVREDDILTAALKSSVPLDITQFVTRRLTTPKQANDGFNEGLEASKRSDCQKLRLSYRVLSNDIDLCQSYRQCRSPVQENPEQDHISQVPVDIQETRLKHGTAYKEAGSMFSDSAVRSLTENKSGTRSQDCCHKCNEAGTIFATNKNIVSSIAYPEYNNILFSGIAASSSNKNLEKREGRELKAEEITFYPGKTDSSLLKHDCLIFNMDTAEKEKHVSSLESDGLEYVGLPEQAYTPDTFLAFFSNSHQGEMKQGLDLCRKQASNIQTLSPPIVTISPEPLNLSLRGPNGQTKRPLLQDNDICPDDSSQTLALPFQHCLKVIASRLKSSQKDSPSEKVHQWSSDTNSKTTELCHKLFFPTDRQQNDISKADNSYLPPSFCSVGTALFQETNKDNIQTHTSTYQADFTTKECKPHTTGHKDRVSLHTSPDTRTSTTPNSETCACNSPRWIRTLDSSVSTQEPEEQDPSSESHGVVISSRLSSPQLRNISKMYGDTEIADNDVWRPW